MLIATGAVLRGNRADSATTDGDAIDSDSGIVILSEGLAFDGWDELWAAFGNLNGIGVWVGTTDRYTFVFGEAQTHFQRFRGKGKKILASHLLTCASADHLPPSSNNSFQSSSKTIDKQGDSQNASS
jgi:hypothetical protein